VCCDTTSAKGVTSTSAVTALPIGWKFIGFTSAFGGALKDAVVERACAAVIFLLMLTFNVTDNENRTSAEILGRDAMSLDDNIFCHTIYGCGSSKVFKIFT